MTVKFEVELDIPETETEPTQRQVEEWIMFHVGYRSTLSGGNPLINSDMESAVTDCYVFDVNS